VAVAVVAEGVVLVVGDAEVVVEGALTLTVGAVCEASPADGASPFEQPAATASARSAAAHLTGTAPIDVRRCRMNLHLSSPDRRRLSSARP
jgi:hypothetical protein